MTYRKVAVLMLTVSLSCILVLSSLGSSKEVRLRVGMQSAHAGVVGETENWLADVIKDFEAANPHVSVEAEPVDGNYPQRMLTFVAAGVAPDVFQGWGDSQRGWAESGWLLDLEPHLTRLFPNAAKDFFPAQWNALKLTAGPLAGIRYGIPMYVNVMGGILYNSDMFDNAGLPYPETMKTWTWTELVDVAKKLTRKTDDADDCWGFLTVTDNTSWVDTWMWGAGGGLLAPDDSRIFTGDTPQSIAGLSFLHDLIWEHGVAPASPWANGLGGPQNAFLSQKTAMMQTYSVWTQEVYRTADFNWNIAPNPVGPVGLRPAFTITDSFSVYAETKYPEESVCLAMALASRQANMGRLKAPFYQMPSLPGLAREYYKLMPDKNLWVFLQSMDQARVDSRVFFAKPAEMNAMFTETWSAVLVRCDTTPTAGMHSIAQAIRSLLK